LFEISEAAPLYLFPYWAEMTWVDQVAPVSSRDLTTFTQQIGRMDVEREEFFQRWVKQCGHVQTIVFDITSLSSYSLGLNEVEWGYNRDGESLPQINLGMIYAETQNLPLYYQIYPGSIPDVSTLKNMVRYLEWLDLDQTLFVMDRGFYSASNLASITDTSLKFLLPLPRTVTLFSDLVAQYRHALTKLTTSFLFHADVLCHLPVMTTVGQIPLSAHLFFDPHTHSEQSLRFLKRLWEAEVSAQRKTFQRPQEARRYLSKQVKGAAQFFRLRQEAGHIELSRKPNTLTQHMANMGVTIFLTNHAGLEREQILTVYRQKDFLEKIFDVLKNEFDGKRLRSGSKDVVEGRLFLKFLSLIVHSALRNTMREQQLLTQYSVREMLYELRKLRLVEMSNGKRVLTELSKRQKNIFKKFDIPLPTIKT
jgi:transposase